jgi:hypothetical protein
MTKPNKASNTELVQTRLPEPLMRRVRTAAAGSRDTIADTIAALIRDGFKHRYIPRGRLMTKTEAGRKGGLAKAAARAAQ